jgi:hypothetical protein
MTKRPMSYLQRRRLCEAHNLLNATIAECQRMAAFRGGKSFGTGFKKRNTRFHYYTDIRAGIWLILASLSDSIEEHDIVA